MLSLAALAVLSPDERGFVEDIYLKYEKKLYAEALGITGNRHDAEDVLRTPFSASSETSPASSESPTARSRASFTYTRNTRRSTYTESAPAA